MYGGVAKTYCLWKMDGQPFKEKNAWYVNMLHPITGLPKKVRWYTDKAHADLMPKPKNEKFKGAFVGFENADDYVLCVRDIDLAPGEAENTSTPIGSAEASGVLVCFLVAFGTLPRMQKFLPSVVRSAFSELLGLSSLRPRRLMYGLSVVLLPAFGSRRQLNERNSK